MQKLWQKLPALALIFAILPAACGGQTSTGGSTASSAPLPSTVHIGASLPLTGADSKIGKFYKDAYELYVKQVNDAGGLPVGSGKVRIALEILDSTSDPQVSAQNYTKLATQDQTDFFLGGYNTTVVLQEVKIANRYKIPYVNGGGSSSEIYAGNVWGFGVLAPIETLASTQLAFIKSEQDLKHLPVPLKMFVAYENSAHGKEFLAGLQEGARISPDRFTITDQLTFEVSSPDAPAILARLQVSGADAFMVDARAQDYSAIQKAYVAKNLYHKYITYGPRGSEKAVRDVLGAGADYLIAAIWFDQNQTGDNVKKWLEMWKATGNTPEWYAAGGWEAVRILTSAISKAGTLDKSKVRETLANTSWTGSIFPGGAIKFNAFGQATNEFIVTQNLPGGKLGIVWPKDQTTAPAVLPIPQK